MLCTMLPVCIPRPHSIKPQVMVFNGSIVPALKKWQYVSPALQTSLQSTLNLNAYLIYWAAEYILSCNKCSHSTDLRYITTKGIAAMFLKGPLNNLISRIYFPVSWVLSCSHLEWSSCWAREIPLYGSVLNLSELILMALSL